MTTGETDKENERQLDMLKQCLNHMHCGGFEGCAIACEDKIVTGYKTREGLCTTCDHWQGLCEKKLDYNPVSIRVNGHHYQTSLESINKPAPKYAGFAGRRFDVKMVGESRHAFLDTFYTCNMWSQGEIPEHFRDKLPDNAEFLNEVTKEVVFDGERFITAFDIQPKPIISGREEFKISKNEPWSLKDKLNTV